MFSWIFSKFLHTAFSDACSRHDLAQGWANFSPRGPHGTSGWSPEGHIKKKNLLDNTNVNQIYFYMKHRPTTVLFCTHKLQLKLNWMFIGKCYWRVAHVTEDLLTLLKSCSCYWRAAHVIEELLMLLKSCSCYWRVAHVTEELLMLLKSCSCYWRLAHVTEDLLMLLKSCTCYWRAAHVTEELLMLLKSGSCYWRVAQCDLCIWPVSCTSLA